MQRCEVCSANVSELRRGRCWGCYTRWAEARPVGVGAVCCMCSEQRRDFLKSVELLGNWMPICYNCAARAAQLSPMPQSIAGVRTALRRDRRLAERRNGGMDDRVFRYDRRTGQRRRVRALDDDDPVVVDDDMIIDILELADSLSTQDEELTKIVEL